MRFVVLGPKAGLLKFRYMNWRDVEHVYVVSPGSVEVGPYDAKGKPAGRLDAQLALVLHAHVVSRDGEPRPGRRTFLVNGLRDIELVGRVCDG